MQFLNEVTEGLDEARSIIARHFYTSFVEITDLTVGPSAEAGWSSLSRRVPDRRLQCALRLVGFVILPSWCRVWLGETPYRPR
jgi:hypothetical protein